MRPVIPVNADNDLQKRIVCEEGVNSADDDRLSFKFNKLFGPLAFHACSNSSGNYDQVLLQI